MPPDEADVPPMNGSEPRIESIRPVTDVRTVGTTVPTIPVTELQDLSDRTLNCRRQHREDRLDDPERLIDDRRRHAEALG